MESGNQRETLFRSKVLNNRFVVYTLIILLLCVTVFAFSKISFIFKPLPTIIGSIFLPILLSGIFFYLLQPIVDFMEQKQIKRTLSIIIIYVLMLVLLAGIVWLVIPPLKAQIQDLVRSTPTLIEDIKGKAGQIANTQLFEKVYSSLEANIDKIGKKVSESISKYGADFTQGIAAVVSALTEVVLSLVMLPILLFYLLKDGKQLPDYIVKRLPTPMRNETKKILYDMNNGLSAYIRGQLVVAFCVGVLLLIGYMIIGLNDPLILAVIGMTTNVVPYLGPVLAIIPAAVIAVVQSPWMLLKLALVWSLAQLIESKVISPLVMGKSLKLHPVTVIFVIIIAGNLFGILGIIFAVPGYTILKVVVTHLYKLIRLRSTMYPDSDQKS